MLTDAAVQWLEDRGLDVETAARFGLESRNPRGARGGEWIAVPFVKDDRVVGCKYREINEKNHSQDAGSEKVWWNGDVITDRGLADEPLIVTEGEWDALALLQSGFSRVVSVPEGAPSEPVGPDAPKYSFIDLGKMRDVRQIIIAGDADGPGAALRTDLVAIFGAARCRWVEWAPHCKDANDVLVRGGAAAMRKCIENARWCSAPGLRLMSDYPEADNTVPEVWRAPITPQFAKAAGFIPGFHSTTTGIPSDGKSTLMNTVTWELARQDIGSGVATFESPPNQQYLRDVGRYLLGRPPEGGQGTKGPWSTADRDRVVAWVDKNISFLDPHELGAQEGVDPTLDWFFETAAAANIRFGRRFFVLDPWSDMTQDRTAGQTEHEFINGMHNQMKRFCRRFKVHVNIVAHPKKIEAEGAGKKRRFKRPTLYDISGSSHWYNAVSLGLVVHKNPRRDMDGEPLPNCTRTTVGVDKVKWRDFQGHEGDHQFQFYPTSGRYGPA